MWWVWLLFKIATLGLSIAFAIFTAIFIMVHLVDRHQNAAEAAANESRIKKCAIVAGLCFFSFVVSAFL